MSQQAAARYACSRRSHPAGQAQHRNGCRTLTCSATREHNGAEPRLSEEEVKRMTDDFVKEIIEGAGADDPESKTYQIRVSHCLKCFFS